MNWKVVAGVVGGLAGGFALGVTYESKHSKKELAQVSAELKNEIEQYKSAYFRVKNEQLAALNPANVEPDGKKPDKTDGYSPNPPLEMVNTHKTDYAAASVAKLDKLKKAVAEAKGKDAEFQEESDEEVEDIQEDGPSETYDGYELTEEPIHMSEKDWAESFDDKNVDHLEWSYYTEDGEVVDSRNEFVLSPEGIVGTDAMDYISTTANDEVYIFVPVENAYYKVTIEHGRSAHVDILGEDGRDKNGE